jgi:hypothetical protein
MQTKTALLTMLKRWVASRTARGSPAEHSQDFEPQQIQQPAARLLASPIPFFVRPRFCCPGEPSGGAFVFKAGEVPLPLPWL